MNVPEEAVDELVNKYSSTHDGRTKLLLSMQTPLSELIQGLSDGRLPMGQIGIARQMRKTAAKLHSNGETRNVATNAGVGFTLEEVMKIANSFCVKCGFKSDLGDHHNASECLVAQVLTT